MRAATLLALVVLVLAPLAAAHLETFSQAKPLVLGPYSALVEPYPAPAYANGALTLRALFTRIDTGAYVNKLDASVDVRYPDGTNATKKLEPDGSGYFIAYVVIRERGDHVARVTVKDDAGAWSNDTTVTVYPDVGVRLRPADPNLPEPTVGEAYPLGILATDNVTGAPSDKLTDLRVDLQRWTDDHLTMLGQETLTLERAGVGTWSVRHTFPEKGMYHLRFASSSGGFNYDDVPLLHVYANDPVPSRAEEKQSPLAPAAAVVAVLALAALLRRR